MKITFINPKAYLDYSGPRAQLYPPLGILSLANFLKSKFADAIELCVVDEKIEEGIPDSIYKSDMVCIGVNSFNYLNGIQHAKKAKSNGAVVVFGGPHATILPKNILRLKKEVDFVITQEGEVSLFMLISSILNHEHDLNKIPNLFYRDNGMIKSSELSFENDLTRLPIIDRSYVPVEKYISAFQAIYQKELNRIEYWRPTSIYSSKGCSWRDKAGGCIFCARLEKGVRFRNATDIWREIRMLIEQYKIDHIWDISDDNLNNPQWFKDFVHSKPKDVNPKFLIYSRASAINEEAISYFKKLNVHEVYIGFESGDSRMLKHAQKGSSQSHNLKVLEILSKCKINVYPSFVLGLPGETEKSLKSTLDFIKQITRSCNFYRVSATILIPIPGSKAFRLLAEHEKLQDKAYLSKDNFDLKLMEKEWAELFTEVDYDTLKGYRDEINNLNIEGVWK